MILQIILMIVHCELIIIVRSMEKTSMYMKRSEVSDQSMSGSGYSYYGQDKKPDEYIFEMGGNDQAWKVLKNLGYDPITDSQKYRESKILLPYELFLKKYSESADLRPVAFLVNENIPKLSTVSEKWLSPKIPLTHPDIDSYSKLGLYPKIFPAYPYAVGYDHNNFLKKDQIYNNFDSTNRGEKTDPSYKTFDAFSKGIKGLHDNQDFKSYHDQSGKKKQLNYNDANNYGLRNAVEKASYSGSFDQKDAHRNGAKTRGYHYVYHKDDYNKQHNFYDKADRKRNFEKYGDFNSKNNNAEKHFVKDGNSDRGSNNNSYSIKNIDDKGKIDKFAKGFGKTSGNEEFHDNYDRYSEKTGKQSGNRSGYII